MDIIKKSKFLSLILRHKPETVDLTLDSAGWARVSEVLVKCNMSMLDLEVVVEQNNKKRFEFNEDRTKIRASQGHSVDVDLEYTPTLPPEHLFHGTSNKAIFEILMNGIKKMQRNHVHLSAEKQTAIEVGRRKGNPFVLVIDAQRMYLDGHRFFLSTNGVWLTEFVPKQYLHDVDMKQYYHDVHCNVTRHEPMGCEGCSCYMTQKLNSAQTKIAELQARLDKTKDYWVKREADSTWLCKCGVRITSEINYCLECSSIRSHDAKKEEE
ncbi:MAG: RNA 2'-phosphotransferase [Candidatus Scalindua sp.]|jgi:putative RNA 2'-phosphotransferase|nr:RNA 2'-phosphotransferase [Candidatus Scalindua sp.]